MSNVPKVQPNSLPSSSLKVTRYGTKEQFLLTFNPSKQGEFVQARERCFFGTAPTLGELKASYDAGMPKAWLVPQLFDISEFCGCRDKISNAQLEQLAEMLTLQYHYLKVTEWMMFFYQFKGGKYGKFYGAVDPMVITTAVPLFLQERARAIDEREDAQRKAEREQWAKEAITYEEYLRLKNEGQTI